MNHPAFHPDWLSWPQTKILLNAFAQAGRELRFVGGAVRDSLLGLEVSDIDAATPTSPQQVMGLLEHAGIRVIPTGLSHGTVTALIEGQSFEITTLRCDVKTFGRHAEVQFTHDWQQDAARRDFTMNALYLDASGKLYDYHGGQADLQQRCVRFIGHPRQRIREDGLRILRFFRFTAFYGDGQADASGLEACIAEKTMLDALSGERIAQEMLKFLQAEAMPGLLAVMHQSGLSPALFGYDIQPRLLQHWPRICLMADSDAILSPQEQSFIALALLCRQKPERKMAEFIIQRWKLSNKQAGLLHFLTQSPLLGLESDEAEQKAQLRRSGKQGFIAKVLLSWMDALNRTPEKAQILSALYRSMLWLAEQWPIPEFPVTGKDLLALGIPAGPAIGEQLAQLECWWEGEGYTPTFEAIMQRVREQV